MLLAAAERRLQLADRLAAAIHDPRDPERVTHAMADILRARIFAIACGYEDANDLDRLRTDPAFKLACGRLPDSGLDLCSQPTCSRVENLPDLRPVVRLGWVLVDLWLLSYAAPPKSVTLDIDDTVDVVHGHQQLSLFNAHYDERCFLPIHIYDAATGRPVSMILRPGKTPTGKEIRSHLRRLVRRIRARWPATRILIRGDGHYGRAEVMAWCENNAIDYVFGLPGTRFSSVSLMKPPTTSAPPHAGAEAGAARLCRDPIQGKIPEDGTSPLRPHRGNHPRPRHRFVVTNLDKGSAAHVCNVIYCARGQAENLIKMHKSQLASDRTSCRSPIANQVRLVLHTAAYWLMLTLREAVPKTHHLSNAEFATLRLRLLKLGARVIETVSRIRLAFAAACPEASLFRQIALTLQPAGP
ncbi:transposase IS4 [Mesorhizobium sp. L103C119B0]|nr:transposase IS4 [Mesorhizobium sp. L103C119B0]